MRWRQMFWLSMSTLAACSTQSAVESNAYDLRDNGLSKLADVICAIHGYKLVENALIVKLPQGSAHKLSLQNVRDGVNDNLDQMVLVTVGSCANSSADYETIEITVPRNATNRPFVIVNPII